jgi:hypothetical protein
VAGKDKNAEIGDKLLGGEWATPTRTQNMEEPDTTKPPPAPKEIVDRQPKIDPWELAKNKRYKVDVSKLLQLEVPTDPQHETTHSRHATKYLLFDNYFDYLCSEKLQSLGLPRLDGQEQAMYYWFYRYSYGYGYSACAMAEATLIKQLGWVRKHVKRVLKSLLDKGVIRAELEFPLFRNQRPQVFRVFLPREILQRALDALPRVQGVIPSEIEQRIPIDPEIKALIRSFTRDPLDTAADA